MNDHFASLNDNGKHKGNGSYDNTRTLMDTPKGATPTIELSLRAEDLMIIWAKIISSIALMI